MALNLSTDLWKHWEKQGRSEFVKQFKHAFKDQENSILSKTEQFRSNAAKAIYDLFWQGIRGRLRKESVLATLSDVVNLHWDLPSIILDVVNIIDAETSLLNDGLQEERLVFCQTVKDMDKFISDKLLKERLEIDTLQDVGTVKNKIFYTKFIKVKTKLYYKQRRFNLFREESEGYAKLITELNQEFSEGANAVKIMDIIKSLIGCFNLDPNRVLDIILESFETRPERHSIFIPLLRSYMPSGNIICEVLGYKFRYFSDSVTPESLFQVTALLLKFSVIGLNEVFAWLSPSDKVINTEWEKDIGEAKEFVRKLNIISTNKDKDPEPEPEKDETEDKYSMNQKFGLCEALLKVGDWTNAQKLMKKLPDQSVIVHEPIAKALANLIHLAIEYVYRKKCFTFPSSRSNKLNENLKLAQQLQANDFSELSTYAFPMVITLGPSLHYDPVLIHKLIRIMRTILSEMAFDNFCAPPKGSEDEATYFEILTLLDAAILPALSYLDCNCCVAEEIWTVVKFYPYHLRYSLYARWKNETYLMQPMLIRRRGNVQKNIKSLMKRVSKENVKPVGRLIGKLSHCSPGFLFDYILLQIQIYDNLIGPVVDSLKYLTSLSYDVLGYCLIESLASADRDRFKHDGTSLSMWLQSLASFCGAIYKKYNIELSGLLQYVANQLKSQRSLDLLILKEVVQKMTGIEAAEEMTNEQLSAMSGGELLRGEAGYFSQVRNTKKSSQRLKDALASNDLAVTLCLLMAQQKHSVIYKETAHNHLKLVGKLYDQCQDTLVQFGTFLGSTYSVDEYVERLPSIHSMLQEYHIHSDVAFFLARPMFIHQINQKYDQLRKSDPNSKKLTTSQKMQKYLEATASIMDPIVESVRPLHGAKVWEDISPQFLVTFWSLSMYDLQVPTDSYQKEISKLKQLSLSALDSKEMNLSKGKKEQERYIALMDKLQDEKKKQQEHVDKIFQRLNQEKDTWFLSRSAKSAKNETITQFLQLCLFPRCTFTALDAIYCAKFVHTIHNLKAANFSTLLCYDRIFCDITYSVTSCTENEATRYGRFLCAMLETVMRWHADQATFNRECANYPGFVTKFRVSNQFSEANDHVGYENYRHVCHKWHYKITKAIVFCLDSKDYMQIRNALIILMRILPHFPVLTKLSQIIERKVEKVREEEKNNRPDLFVLASSYIGQLKTKSAQMIKESDFHQVSEKPTRDATDLKSVSNGDLKEKRDKEKFERKTTKIIVSVDKEVKIEIKDESHEKDKLKEVKKEERSKERERERDDERKKEKEKKKEHRLESPTAAEIPQQIDKHFIGDYYEYEKDHDRDRDLSSVSNSSNGSLHRRSQEVIDYEKVEVKRRKLESSSSKKQDDNGEVRKERTSKTKDRKEKLSEEEKDARKERKLGRKRERIEEALQTEHKRRREANQNGEDETVPREKYHLRLNKWSEEKALDDGERKNFHFAHSGRRKSMLAPILSKIRNVSDGYDNDRRGDGHISVPVEKLPAKKVKRHSIHGMMEEENIIRPHQEIQQLTLEEKKFLLAVERGDMAGTRRMLQKAQDTDYININCVDPLGRTALLMAIDNENLEMVELLINYNVDTKDALLHAISEEFVEAVEVLLDHEELNLQNEGIHNWEVVREDTSTFTPDITPLILAAHRDNYEIIKILLDRGSILPMPHDVRCGCDECVLSRQEDSLRHSRSRINAYRALASPSLIALSSKDPILTAFELSWELRRLSFLEHEFKIEYLELRKQCQDFATALLDHTRSSNELEILLNHDPTGPVYEHGERMHLNRLKLAIKLRQKKVQFVAHPNVQQLLASIWYEGLPGFRRKNMALQALDIIRIGMLFPVFSVAYILAPYSTIGQTMRKPFIKFICHSASYFTFLFLLMLASQRIETFIGGWFWQQTTFIQDEEVPTKRGAKPTFIEWLILAWVSGLIWSEIKQLWDVGLQEYLNDMWNVIDFVTNSLYVATVALRVVSFIQVRKEMSFNKYAADLPREKWDTWDPMLISEGLFSAANIFSSLKLVYIFSVNPHLGPLQVSLSRMVMDIMKFFFLYVLVLFAFSSGLNQLLWYYADLEKKRCPEVSMNTSVYVNGTADPNACIVWRRFANLFETTQTLFWAVFGLIDLDSFELDGIKIFTRFWGMLMFGTYSVINIVVLLNLLIAMMNHSYQLISERADIEWKFARSKLWISYFEEGGTCPPPFNIIPTPKSIWYVAKWARRIFCSGSSAARREHLKTIRRKAQQANDRDIKYQQIMRNLVRRYVTVEQRKAESQGVTEDDVNEIKQDISAFRCELVEILKNSGMDTNVTAAQGTGAGGKKNRQKERRLMKGFNIAPPGSTGSLAPVAEFSTSLDHFESQNEVLNSTFSNIFSPNFLHRKQMSCCSTTPPCSFGGLLKDQIHLQNVSKFNKAVTKSYNKRIVTHKKRWGTLIEAAKAGNVSRILGRSRSEDSVCNSISSVSENFPTSAEHFTPMENNRHANGSSSGLNALAALKKKRKTFSSSKNSSPVLESMLANAESHNEKAIKRVSSYPACSTIEERDLSKPRRHEQTQSQHESIEIQSEFTYSEEIHMEPSGTSGNSREPLLNVSVNSNATN